jgi:hypothetical protein
MVDRRVVDRAQHPVRHIRRAGTLQEVSPGDMAGFGHLLNLRNRARLRQPAPDCQTGARG